MDWSETARLRPASKTVCAADAPMDQSALGPVSHDGNCPLSKPPTSPKVIVGKKAARAIPTCSLADATLLSAPAISGRLSNSSDGSPGGGTRGMAGNVAGGRLNEEAGWPQRSANALHKCARL